MRIICAFTVAVLSEGMLRWIFLPLLAIAAHAQVYQGKTLVTASLVSDTAGIVPGKPFEVGVLLEMAPRWHTYWEYPGDAGLPASIAWTLPEGFVAGPIQWPLPDRVIEPGEIEVYAYKDKVLLLTAIIPPAEIAEKTVTLRAKVDWLVCEEICIPGSASLETLSSGGSSRDGSKHRTLFRFSRASSRRHAGSVSTHMDEERQPSRIECERFEGCESGGSIPASREGRASGTPASWADSKRRCDDKV